MIILLLEPIFGLGEKHEIAEIEYDDAIELLSKRQALVVTPGVRKRYKEFIRNAASSTL